MKVQTQSGRRWKSGTAGAVLVILIGIGLPRSLGEWLADLSFDLPFRLRPNRSVEEVRIISMDETSAKALNQPPGEVVWDRQLHGQLVDRLIDSHAKAIVFDVLFDRPGEHDDEFASALLRARESGIPVILGGKVEVSQKAGSPTIVEIPPIPLFERAAPWGVAELGRPETTRRLLFAGTDRVPTMARRAAELTKSKPLRQPPAEAWINYYGPPGFIRSHAYDAALNTNLLAHGEFTNKVCFVGAGPRTPFVTGVRSDEWNTPYGRKVSGAEITATVYLNLTHGEWLNGLSRWTEALIVVLTGIAFGFGLNFLRPIAAAGVGLAAALATTAMACAWMWHQNVWFSWLIIAGVQIPAAVAWSTLAYTRRLTHEKARLEEKLAGVALTPTVPNPPEAAPTSVTSAQTVVAAGGIGPRQTDWIPVIPDHTILRRVGKGAYGEVWLARNAIGTYHAVKIIRREDFNEVEPFEREFRGIQKFMPVSRGHSGLVLILHVGRHDQQGFIYYIMEPADDETTGPQIDPESYSPRNLAKVIRQRGHLPAAECLQLGLDLTAALDFLHQQQLIHRDIKPANIIFVRGKPKLADIGLVTDIAKTGRDVTYLGTKGYIAPEGPGTPAADIYSLGKVLYEACMGLGCEQFPEIPATLVQRPDHDRLLQLNKILLQACRQDPQQRYQSAAEVRKDLLSLQNAPP